MSDELQKVISSLNIQWREVNKGALHYYQADVGDHQLFACQLAVTGLHSEVQWFISHKDNPNDTLYEGIESVSMAILLIKPRPNEQPQDPLMNAMRAAELKYVEKIYLDQVIKEELLGGK